MTRILLCFGALALLVGCIRNAAPVPPDSQPCIFSEQPKSNLAWESGRAAFVISGRAVFLRDGTPIQRALVRVNPGKHLTTTDTAGRFEFTGLRGGRYFVEVHAMGWVPASDSTAPSLAVRRPGLATLSRRPTKPE
jgi:carboxypeptidase family protein